MIRMSERSLSYRFSPRIARFLGRTYAPSFSSGYTFAPARGLVTNYAYSPSYSSSSQYSPSSFLSNDNTYSPFYDTSTDYSPRLKTSNDYNPLSFIDKRQIYAPFNFYDYERKSEYAPTNILVRLPKIVIDDSTLRYLTAYNRFILGLLEVL